MTEHFQLSGYDDRKELLATRYTRAGKSLFVVALPLHLVPSHLPVPDPDRPFEGNRRVSSLHAAKFGEYWRENERWACPPLLLDTTYPLSESFVPKFSAAGVEFGVVKLPHNSAQELEILDGQHRILGWKIAFDRLIEDLKQARTRLQGSRESQDPAGVSYWEEKLAALQESHARLQREYITLEILEGVTLADHKQFFHDIAVNAKGITKSITVSFDRRNVMNRVALSLAETHPLLVEKVDFEKDRVTGGNENFISGRNLVDVVKHVVVGIDGRMTVRREKAFKETAIERMADKFFELLLDSFKPLNLVKEDELHPSDLRDRSLLGSPTVLRILAGVFHELAVDLSDEDNPRITEEGLQLARNLFDGLAPTMSFPLNRDWYDTGFFPDPSSKAPSSRSQDLRGLTDLLISWGKSGQLFLKP